MKNTEQIKNIIEATSMSRLEKDAVKKSILDLQGVDQQRELLLAFSEYVNGRIFSDNEPFYKEEVDEWLSNNCFELTNKEN